MKKAVAFVFLALLAASAALAAPADVSADRRAARELFEKNLRAIQKRDKAAYLACYLDSTGLAVTGRKGPSSVTKIAKQAGEKWPDTLVADDLQLVPVSPGVVYGTYRYRVRYGADEHAGLSERLFLKTPKGWRIAVTSAFEAPRRHAAAAARLSGATLVDGNGGAAVKNAVVVVRDGRIDCAGPRGRVPRARGRRRARTRGARGSCRASSTRTSTSPRRAGPTGGPTRSTFARRTRTRPSRRTCASTPSASSGPTSAPASRRSSTSAATRGRSTSRRGPRTTRSRRASAAAGPLLSTIDSLAEPARRAPVPLLEGRREREDRSLLPRVARRAGRQGLVHRAAGPARDGDVRPAVLAAGRGGEEARPSAHRPRDGPRRGEGRAEGRGEAPRPQRLGPARRRRVPRAREEERHDLRPDARRRRRLRARSRGGRRARARRVRRPERLRRSRDARARSPRRPASTREARGAVRPREARGVREGVGSRTSSACATRASRSRWARTPATRGRCTGRRSTPRWRRCRRPASRRWRSSSPRRASAPARWAATTSGRSRRASSRTSSSSGPTRRRRREPPEAQRRRARRHAATGRGALGRDRGPEVGTRADSGRAGPVTGLTPLFRSLRI